MLENARTPASDTYLGQPPTEIEGLTDETIHIADELRQAAERGTACVRQARSDCRPTLLVVESRMVTMTKLLSVDWPLVGP